MIPKLQRTGFELQTSYVEVIDMEVMALPAVALPLFKFHNNAFVT